MHRSGTWINIHQCPHDRHLFFLARKMKKAGVLDFVGTNLGSLTVVGKDGKKIIIRNQEDLQNLTNQPLSRFGNEELDDSAVVMDC